MKDGPTLQQLPTLLSTIHEANKTQINIIIILCQSFRPGSSQWAILCSFGITKDPWLYMVQYFTGRCQCVHMNGSCSNILPVYCQVYPRGASWASPIFIFLVYINDLFSSVQFSHSYYLLLMIQNASLTSL